MAIIPDNPIYYAPPAAISMDRLLASLAETVAADGDLSGWAMTVYGRQHTVLLGYDPRNPPEDDKYPLISLTPVASVEGYAEARQYVIAAAAGIYDATSAVRVEANVEELQSTLRLRELLEKLIAAVITAELYGGYVGRVEVEYHQAEFFPYLLAEAVFTVLVDDEFRDPVVGA